MMSFLRQIPGAIWLHFTLGALIGGSAVAWWKWPDQGGNFFAEAAGICLTVLIIEQLLKRDEENRLLPARLAAARDAHAIASTARDFIWNLSRSAVPASAVQRVEKEASGMPEPWLADYIGDIGANDPAPYARPLPPYQPLTWREMLPREVSTLQTLINRYLERHVALGDPRLTGAVGEFERNGLFHTMSYGSDFLWQFGSNRSLYAELIEGIRKLIETTNEVIAQQPTWGEVLPPIKFAWDELANEIRRHPVATDLAPHRPRG